MWGEEEQHQLLARTVACGRSSSGLPSECGKRRSSSTTWQQVGCGMNRRPHKEEGHLGHPIYSVISNRIKRANHQSFSKCVADNQLQGKGGQILEVQAKVRQILKFPFFFCLAEF